MLTSSMSTKSTKSSSRPGQCIISFIRGMGRSAGGLRLEKCKSRQALAVGAFQRSRDEGRLKQSSVKERRGVVWRATEVCTS